MAMIINLRNAADAHKKHCDENCNVSLWQLKDTASFIMHSVWASEFPEARKLLEDWPS
jgi:hypothetical protein